MQITTDHIVKGFFVNSAGNTITFEGKAIRLYSIQGVLPMVEIDTPDGSMHSQIANAVVVGEYKAPKTEKAAVGNRDKVRGNAIAEGMTILVSLQNFYGDEEPRLYPDHRITKATAVKVTGTPTIDLHSNGGKAARYYNIPTDQGTVRCSASQTITVVSN